MGGGSNGDIERDGGLKPGELPLLPWARELGTAKRSKDEPYTACLPMSVPRVNPYPWKFAMTYTSKGLSHIYVLHETGDAGAHRVVYMDGRKHPDDLIPSWWGHSIGRWEGDSLVIDTVGYNDKFWFDSRGTPHTEQLHTVEKWTRLNYGRIQNDFTLDDPGAFSKPVQLKFIGRLLRPDLKTGGGDLMEFICLEDNEYGAAAGAPGHRLRHSPTRNGRVIRPDTCGRYCNENEVGNPGGRARPVQPDGAGAGASRIRHRVRRGEEGQARPAPSRRSPGPIRTCASTSMSPTPTAR